PARRGAGAVERGGLENRWPCKRPVGSNPTPAALAAAYVGVRVGEDLERLGGLHDDLHPLRPPQIVGDDAQPAGAPSPEKLEGDARRLTGIELNRTFHIRTMARSVGRAPARTAGPS